jgi:hypothetical protein
MLIPHEVHKPAFQIDGPMMQTARTLVPTAVVATARTYGTKHHEEKGHKRKRKFRYVWDDESAISDDAQTEDGVRDSFAVLLGGLAEAY